MRILKLYTPALLISLVFAGTNIFAATVTSSFTVTATVANNCRFVAGPIADLNFSTAYDITDPTANDSGQTSFSVRCTNTLAYGMYITGNTGMSDGTDTLNYQLFKDAARLTQWPTASYTPFDYTGNGNPQAYTIYGRIPALQAVGAGSYSSATAPATDPVVNVEW